MDGRRRTIEVDEAVADALEKRAAEGSMSVSDLLAAEYLQAGDLQSAAIEMPPDEAAELDDRAAEWERDRLGYDAAEVADWLRGSVRGQDLPFPKLRKY